MEPQFIVYELVDKLIHVDLDTDEDLTVLDQYMYCSSEQEAIDYIKNLKLKYPTNNFTYLKVY